MLEAYKTFIQLCVFRNSVKRANASTTTLLFVCLLFSFSTFLWFHLSPDLADPINFYGRTIVIFGVFNVLMYVSLVYRQKQSRYRKVLSAFVGTRTLIDLCMIMILLLIPTNEELRQVLTTMIALWRMCIVGNILKDGLDVSLPAGILISIVYTFISIVIANLSMGLPDLQEAIPSNE